MALRSQVVRRDTFGCGSDLHPLAAPFWLVLFLVPPGRSEAPLPNQFLWKARCDSGVPYRGRADRIPHGVAWRGRDTRVKLIARAKTCRATTSFLDQGQARPAAGCRTAARTELAAQWTLSFGVAAPFPNERSAQHLRHRPDPDTLSQILTFSPVATERMKTRIIRRKF